MTRVKIFAAILAAVVMVLNSGSQLFGALIDTRTDTDSGGATVDGNISANEYGPSNSYSYAGGGSGFGGTLGGGTLYFQSDATNLYIGFQPGGNLNDIVTIHLDTRAGGFTDADMNDTADPGRNLVSNLTRDVDDPFPSGVLPDFGLAIGNFGIVLFELNAGSSPGHLEFKKFDGTFTGNGTNPREIALSLSGDLDSPAGGINFFASYGSNTNFMSNESIPAEAFNSAGNPGFDNGGNPLVHANYNHFAVVPEPGAFLLCGALAALAASIAIKKRLMKQSSEGADCGE